jgi:hypothetical protein
MDAWLLRPRNHFMPGKILPRIPKKSRSLFNYTTVDGLLGIIKDRALFATHADFSNDSSECRLIRPYLTQILTAEYEKIVPMLIERKVISSNLLRDHGRAAFEMEAQNLVNAMLRATNNSAPYFIFSFCIHDKADYEYSHGLLSQWRSYARGGFAIEFDELELDALSKDETAGWRYQGIITDTVSYKNHEERVKPELFSGMAGAFIRTINESSLRLTMSLSKRREINEILGNKSVDDFARPFLSVAPFLKHGGFEEENEYRIVALCNRRTKSDPGENRKVKEIRFRPRSNGDLVPYIALYDGLQKPLPIKTVIVGPHSQQENQRMAVELLLERHELSAAVRVSEIPFRG